jgi:hypothetical protein
VKAAAIVALLFAAQVLAAPQQSGTTIDQLGWLAGCWEGSGKGRVVEEHWMKPAGKTMLGVGRTVVGNQTVDYEFVQIKQSEDGGIQYIAKPANQNEASFKLVKSGEREVIFENPLHDFPQRIIYRLESDGSLLARIEGVNNGRQRTIDFPMKRRSCE